MRKDQNKPYMMNSISELHRILELPKPEHPLISVIDFEQITCYADEALRSVSYNFYCIALKKGFEGKMKYGQNYYDFDEGVMTFFAPNQIVSTEIVSDLKLSGWWLVVHPDFLINYPLFKNIKQYGYFSYGVNEALHLSEKEEAAVTNIMQIITQEYQLPIDQYSQDVMIAQIELLLTYCNRYYNRQFITRKHASNDLLIQMENILEAYIQADNLQLKGIPTVDYLAKELNVTSHYLSDMLRQLTGLNTQQHIHNKIIEFAKELLSTTDLTVGEIAFRLGFEYSQSFNKLFKNKTNQSPIEYRNSLN